ncbi:MAG TPA: hypothetical protein DC049_18765, partial [Spirochaetia bacterium]|nr:hypothetical protein [Spirochaetia bacterium]
MIFKKYTQPAAAKVIYLFFLTFCLFPAEKNQPVTLKKWLHVPVYDCTAAKEIIKTAKELGYETIIIRWEGKLNIGPVKNEKFSRQEAEDLIDYVKNRLGLEAIPEIKLLSKTQLTFGQNFIKEHPEMILTGEGLRANTMDVFQKTESGKTVLEEIVLPFIDEYAGLYRNPSHFYLGWDEYPTEDIKKIADKHNMTVSDVWAGTLNTVCDHLIRKKITPMISGDQMLSPALADENNALKYPADSRFKYFSPLYSRMPVNSAVDLLPCITDIKNKDKIAVVPWHYNKGSLEGEYPSIDFFKWLGFGQIYGASWFGDSAISAFSGYAHKKNCTGMIATLWHIHNSPAVKPLLLPVLVNSIQYFNNPGLPVPADINPKIIIRSDNKNTAAVKPGDTILLSLSAAGSGLRFNLRQRSGDDAKDYKEWEQMPFESREQWLKSEQGKDYVSWKPARPGFYDLVGETYKNNLLHQGYMECGLLVSPVSVAEPAPGNCLLGADLTKDIVQCDGISAVILRGKGNAKFGILKNGAIAGPEGVDCRGTGGILIYKSAYDCNALLAERTAMIEFRINKEQG